jgi:hypothetical protein
MTEGQRLRGGERGENVPVKLAIVYVQLELVPALYVKIPAPSAPLSASLGASAKQGRILSQSALSTTCSSTGELLPLNVPSPL